MSDLTDERLAALEKLAALHTEAITRAAALLADLTATHAAFGAVLAAIASALDPQDRGRVRALARAAAENAGGSKVVLTLVDGLTSEPADAGMVLFELPRALQ